jgi:hypothetical protein
MIVFSNLGILMNIDLPVPQKSGWLPIMQSLTILASTATNLPADHIARRSIRVSDLCKHT